MKQNPSSPRLDFIDIRRQLIEMRSSHSSDPGPEQRSELKTGVLRSSCLDRDLRFRRSNTRKITGQKLLVRRKAQQVYRVPQIKQQRRSLPQRTRYHGSWITFDCGFQGYECQVCCEVVWRKGRTIGAKFRGRRAGSRSLTAVPLSVPSNVIVAHLPFHYAGVISFCASQPLRRPNSPSWS
jgi:hypothetical protein